MEQNELTVSQVAKALGISADAVRQAIGRGHIIARKLSEDSAVWLCDAVSVELYRNRTQPDGVPRPGRPKKQDVESLANA